MKFSQHKDISVKEADVVRGRFLIDFRETEYLLVFADNKVCLFNSQQEHIGTIRTVSPTSGALWLSDDIVGEYRIDESGQYSIHPIEKGFKLVNVSVRVDPLLHLLTAFHAK